MVISLKTIKENITNEIIIKNSRFITILCKLQNNKIENILDKIKKDYPKATHYCYAYIYGEEKHSSDDGEPGGTAGIPMLNVLEKEDLNNILVVIVRYFGGIKLGAGGLVRAYTKSVTEVLKKAHFLSLENGYQVKIIFDYNAQKKIDYLLKDIQIISRTYQAQVTYIALMPKIFLEEKNKELNYEIIKEVYIEKDLN